MTHSVSSRNEVPIRLTDERWAHIVEEHAELAVFATRFWKQYPTPSACCRGMPESCWLCAWYSRAKRW